MDNSSPVRIKRVTTRVFDYLLSQSRPQTKNEIVSAFPGRRQDKIRAIKTLLNHSKIESVGTGVKGDPYKYKLTSTVPCQVVSQADYVFQGEVVIL